MVQIKTKKLIARGILGTLMLGGMLTATTLADDYMYVVATHLNVRSAGTFRSSIVATVDTGYKVTLLESLDNGWKKVLLANGKEGYVNGRYLTDTEPYFEKALGSSYVVSVPTAFVRGEGLESKVAVLKKGDILEVMDEKVYLGKWLRVKVAGATVARYNDRVGYISKKLVQVAEGSEYIPMTESTIGITEEQTLNSAPSDTGSTDTSGFSDLLGSITTDTSSTGSEAVATGSESVMSGSIESASGSVDSSASFEDLLGGLLK